MHFIYSLSFWALRKTPPFQIRKTNPKSIQQRESVKRSKFESRINNDNLDNNMVYIIMWYT